MRVFKSILGTCIAAAMFLLATTSANALSISADYSFLGTVYQDASGILSNTNAAGSTDVTDIFKDNFETAINYWENAVQLPGWSTSFTVQLASLTGAVGNNATQSHDGNGRPSSNVMNVDNDSVQFFVDSTPWENSEFDMADYTKSLGGTNVNIGRYGTASSGSAADNSGHYDLLSLFLHEMEHGLGFSRYTDRWGNVVSADQMTIPTTVSGFASDFVIPLTGSHIDGNAEGGDWDYTAIAYQGWPSKTRALLSEADILGVAAIAGATSSQVNLNPSPFQTSVPGPIPEPGTLSLMFLGLTFFCGLRRRD